MAKTGLIPILLLLACSPSPSEPESCPPGQQIDTVGVNLETGEPAIFLCNPPIVN